MNNLSNTYFCNNCGIYGHIFYQCKQPITSVGIIVYRFNKILKEYEYLMIRRKDTIGYVEYAYAVANKMTTVKMINKANKTVEANLKSFASAADNAKWSADNGFYQLLTNQPGAASWPIVATTFILVPEANPKDKQKVAVNKASLKFFSWAFKNGNAMAKDLNYIVVPASAQKKIEASWTVPHHPLT